MATLDYSVRTPKLVESIESSEEIDAENKDTIMEFLRDLRVMDYSDARIYKLLAHLKKIGEQADFPFEDADTEDIKDIVAWVNDRDLADSTKRDYKVVLKRFYKWIDGDGEYPECVDWMNTTRKNSNDTLPKDILTEEDVQKLIEAAKNPRDKAFIALLWETGARIGELIDLTIGDIKNHKHGKKVVIEGKTGARRLPLISSVPHIQSWLNSHPRSDEKEAPLWVNIGTRNTGKKVEYRTMKKALDQTVERTDIEKPVNPHHFRHSRATYLASKFTEAQMCEWFGWVQGSKQPAKYVHLSGRDIDADYAKLHGIKDEEETEETELAPIECPRCGEKNDPNAQFCHKCAFALDEETAMEMEKTEEETLAKFAELQDEDVMEMLETISKMYELAKKDPEIRKKIKDINLS